MVADVGMLREALAGPLHDSQAALQVAIAFNELSFPRCALLHQARRIFCRASMLNHSCAPNVEASWSDATRCLEIRAIRELREGEEILVSYVDPAMTRSQRHEALGFVCNCTGCDFIGEEPSVLCAEGLPPPKPSGDPTRVPGRTTSAKGHLQDEE